MGFWVIMWSSMSGPSSGTVIEGGMVAAAEVYMAGAQVAEAYEAGAQQAEVAGE